MAWRKDWLISPAVINDRIEAAVKQRRRAYRLQRKQRMAESTHIETIQATKAQQAVQQQHEFFLRQFLAAFDPREDDRTLDYPALLHRIQVVLSRLIAALGD
jgi:hypothetical protein